MRNVKPRTLNIQRPAGRRPSCHEKTFTEKGYDWQWSKPGGTRNQAMNRDCWLCVRCAAAGYDQSAAQVDHIVPTDVRPDLFHDLDNLQSLCPACHATKTADDVRRYGSRQDAEGGRLTAEQQRNRAEACRQGGGEG